MTELLPRYQALAARIGNTPLVSLPAPGNNRIWAKDESANPGGSHYDRVFLSLLNDLEQKGKIVPGITTIVEVTSGSAGISCAFLCQALGYGCQIYAPENLPESRKAPIRAYGAELVETPAKGYVATAAAEMREFILAHLRDKDGKIRRFYPADHSRSEVSVSAMMPLVAEAIQQAGHGFTCFIGSSGNGVTINGIARPLKAACPFAKVLSYDPASCPTAYWMRYGRPEGVEVPGHVLYGAGGFDIEFPLLQQAVDTWLIDETLVVKEAQYDLDTAELHTLGHKVGRTSVASYNLAVEYCQERSNQDVLIAFYDKADRY
jgi:cysteine synthase A